STVQHRNYHFATRSPGTVTTHPTFRTVAGIWRISPSATTARFAAAIAFIGEEKTSLTVFFPIGSVTRTEARLILASSDQALKTIPVCASVRLDATRLGR